MAMRLPFAIVLGLLALLGAALLYVLVLPATPPEPAVRPAEAAKPGLVRKVQPPAPMAPAPAPPGVTNLASLPHPEVTATAAVPPAVKAAPPKPVGHPDVVIPGSRADYLADLDNVRLMFRDYRSLMGDNPVGSNAEITKSLMGDNPKRAKLGPPGGQGINASGELVDRWGTPYFFHQMSATTMEIRSAGPDKIMYTVDDVVLR